MSENEQKAKIDAKEILGMVVYFAVIILAMFLIIHFVGQRTEVVGQSMENTLSDGDNLIVDKISYRFKEPERFDIIIFPYQYEEDTYYIKRIIGLPGEIIRIDEDGNIYVNDEILNENYGREVIQNPGIAKDEIQLEEDEYFVLGDNRNNSSDSRDPSVGIVCRADIVGRAWLRIYPFQDFGWVKHQ